MDSINQVKEDIEDIIKTSTFYSKLKLVEENIMFKDRTEQEIYITGRIAMTYKQEEGEVSSKVEAYLIKKYGNEVGAEKMKTTWKVSSGICEGGKFNSIEVNDLQGNKVNVEHKIGTILLVDIWATWCGYCHEPMQHNVDIMAKNTDFASKDVNIVGISCDQDYSKWKSFVATKLWQTIPQYRNIDAMKIAGINGIPYIFIVNKNGVVVYQGHPMSIDLENTLKNLIEGKNIIRTSPSEEEEHENNHNPFWNELDAETKMEIVNDCTNMLINCGLNDIQFFVTTTKTKNLSSGTETVTNVPILQGFLSEYQYDLVETIMVEIQSTYNLNGIRPNLRANN